jgi:hypothetical protein
LDPEEEFAGLLVPVEEWHVVMVEVERRSGHLAHALGSDQMVEVSVRRDDRRDDQPLTSDLLDQDVGIATRIDDDRFFRCRVAYDVAIACERPDLSVQEDLHARIPFVR